MPSDNILESILQREGGFVNNPNDRGGPTNFGITIGTLSNFRKTVQSTSDVENLTKEEAKEIYRKEYITKPGLDRINDDRIADFLVDSAVQHGPRTAVLFFQRSLGVTDDGVLGPNTLKAFGEITDKHDLYQKIYRARMEYYGRILRNKSQWGFAAGWFNRMAELA